VGEDAEGAARRGRHARTRGAGAGPARAVVDPLYAAARAPRLHNTAWLQSCLYLLHDVYSHWITPATSSFKPGSRSTRTTAGRAWLAVHRVTGPGNCCLPCFRSVVPYERLCQGLRRRRGFGFIYRRLRVILRHSLLVRAGPCTSAEGGAGCSLANGAAFACGYVS
jgi:hypothetical protein